MPEKVRLLLASDTSGHTAGYYVVARGLSDAGIEVIPIGQAEPYEIADAALHEDVDFIGYRVMDRDPVGLIASLRPCLEERSIGHIPLIVGGIVRQDAIPTLQAQGVVGVFGPGSRLPEIVAFIEERQQQREGRAPVER